jgi:hypothetical protein
VNGAPALADGVEFVRAADLPAPRWLGSLPRAETACAWDLGSLAPAIRSARTVGKLRFRVPPQAAAGAAYRVMFANADGAPDMQTQYDWETIPGQVVVQAAASAPASRVSVEWRQRFFGSSAGAEAADDADPDGDGMSNVAEFLAGTDPRDARSQLHLICTPQAQADGTLSVTLRWLSAPGKTYVVESASDPGRGAWSAQASGLAGTGAWLEWHQTEVSGSLRFYRVRMSP